MSESTYGFLAMCSLLGILLSYTLPIIGGIMGTCMICFSNVLILSLVLKKRCRPKNGHVAVSMVELVTEL